MTIVKATLVRPDGTAWQFQPVTVGVVGAGFVTGTGGSIIGHTVKGHTDTTGLVQFDLAASNTGEWYVWTNPDGAQYTFTVPATGGPYTLQSRLVNPPTPLGTPGVTQQQLDDRIASLGTGGTVSTASISDAGATGILVMKAGTTATARSALGLGTAATADSTSFAPAAAAVPVGGTTGQVLTKNTATDRDVSWTTVSAGAGSGASAVDNGNGTGTLTITAGGSASAADNGNGTGTLTI